jgi:[DsrC]-trisulfide reductase subunit J
MQQFQKRMHNTLITIAGLAMLAFSAFAFASPEGKPSFAPEVPHPANGSTECVQPEDEMKKNHMNYILHQRDETMYKGIRTKQYSLKECINCHVPKNSEARFGDDKHFCSSCHNFTGVSIDCFQCHMDRPMDKTKKSSGTNPHGAQISKPVATEIASTSADATSTKGSKQ